MSDATGLSVVIPALNEGRCIAASVSSAHRLGEGVEVLVVDGGSGDRTRQIARDAGARVVPARRGRGRQCAAGARTARGGLLVFLHADTRLPGGSGDQLRSLFQDPSVHVAQFRRRFNRSGVLLELCARLSSLDSIWTRFGDQGIVVRREFYQDIGGFPEWSLFEDVDFLRRARRRERIRLVPIAATVSSRRYSGRSVTAEQFRNALLIARYLGGADPEELSARYLNRGETRRVQAPSLHNDPVS